jgi:putative methionine-R-sulfoxide reductase with GAF domain/anti-sigma regulatory factor (Ser/Thr protein kinase)
VTENFPFPDGPDASPLMTADSATALERAEERLRDIGLVTDSGFGHLDLDELLTMLLDRVLGLLLCDTAAALLYDDASNQLVARAARGVEEEVRQGVRVPVGAGFAGRIAAERRPVVLDKVDSSTVTNPILWEKGIRTMLGVPMLAGGNLVGVLHVGSYSQRTFSKDEVLLLELAADRIASAVQAGIAESERRAAGVLQRSLLPSALPRIAQFEFASRYAPAEMGGIGGDWYDAFVLPNGDVWVMTGDVAGHGLRAAVVMGRLRSALRAYALLGMAPEDVLQSANRKLQYFELDATATVVSAVFSPPYDVVRMVSAGHPPPVMVAPGKEPILVPLSPAPPLGAVADLEAQSFSEFMEPGEVLLLYTDGLIERRGESLTDGLERLRVAVRPQDAEAVCRHVMDALIGNWVPQDDVALLALRRSPQVYLPTDAPHPAARHPATLVARSPLYDRDPRSVGAVRSFVAEQLTDFDAATLSSVLLMTSELANNALEHTRTMFGVTVEVDSDNLIHVEVVDFGSGAPVVRQPHPTDDHGRGLQIVRRLAHTWGVQKREGGVGKSTWFTSHGHRVSGPAGPPPVT